MKRLIFLLYLFISFAGVVLAQPRLTSDKQTAEIGQVQWKEPIRVKYTITNTGKDPLVLTDVTTSCGCVVAKWTQGPIDPQMQGVVEVEFDAELLGTFHKSIAIYSNADPSLVYLYFTGEVVQEITDFSRTHPYKIGDILVDKKQLVFPENRNGEKQVIVLNIVNQKKNSYRPMLMHLPSYIEMNAEPDILQKGEKGLITLTLNPEAVREYGHYNKAVYLSRFSGDKVGPDNEFSLQYTLLPKLPLNTSVSPQLRFSVTELDFSADLQKKSKVSKTIQLTNQGNAELKILKVQVFHPSVKVQLNKTSIQPGQRGKLKITIENDVNNLFKKEKVLLITNDPIHSKEEITIKQ